MGNENSTFSFFRFVTGSKKAVARRVRNHLPPLHFLQYDISTLQLRTCCPVELWLVDWGNIHLALRQFSSRCEEAGTWLGTSTSRPRYCRKWKGCWNESRPHMKDLKLLGIFLPSGDKMEHKINDWIGVEGSHSERGSWTWIGLIGLLPFTYLV